MGWKNVKEHYRIGHIVCVTEKGICIGSPYIHDLLVIAADGKSIVKPYTERRSNEDLWRYQKEMDADMGKLFELVVNPDTFEQSVTVWTYNGGEIIEKKCEEPGWPNVTHDGELMHENTFSTDRAKVVGWAKRDAKLGVEMFRERLQEKRTEFLEWEVRLRQEEENVRKLAADFPEVKEAE
jgi:hypothetical protein